VLDKAFEIIREQLDLEDWMLEQREAVAAHCCSGFRSIVTVSPCSSKPLLSAALTLPRRNSSRQPR